MKGGGGNSLGIKLRDTLEFVKTIPPWRKRERKRERLDIIKMPKMKMKNLP